jgi:predicted component of type VI protein secretion system
MPAQLLSLNEGPNILLDKPILLLGRHPECDVQIDSRKISRRHCCIAQVSDYLVVRDLGSTNGVRINGVRVLEGRLAPGDELTIGTYRYKVVWDSLIKPSVPAALARPVAKPVLPIPADDDDEILESCDEPVPLPEPRKSNPDIPLHLVKPPSPSTSPAGRQQVPPVDDPLILPDHLELLPNSDIYSINPLHPPSSHPPHQSSSP